MQTHLHYGDCSKPNHDTTQLKSYPYTFSRLKHGHTYETPICLPDHNLIATENYYISVSNSHLMLLSPDTYWFKSWKSNSSFVTGKKHFCPTTSSQDLLQSLKLPSTACLVLVYVLCGSTLETQCTHLPFRDWTSRDSGKKPLKTGSWTHKAWQRQQLVLSLANQYSYFCLFGGCFVKGS